MDITESLQELCVDVLADNLDAICYQGVAKDQTDSVRGEKVMWTYLKPGIQLPSVIAEQLYDAVNTRIMRDLRFMEAVSDVGNVSMTSINYYEGVDTESAGALILHKPSYLHLCHIGETKTTRDYWKAIIENSENLKLLRTPFFPCADTDSDEWETCEMKCLPLIPYSSKLHTLAIKSESFYSLGHSEIRFLPYFIQRCPALTHLDLSCVKQPLDKNGHRCKQDNFKFDEVIPSLVQLKTLVLFDCEGVYSKIIPALKQLHNLEALDLGVNEHPKTYSGVEQDMEELIKALPKLVHLDISGTEGLVTVDNGEPQDSKQYRPIPWLGDRRLKFLGLCGCFEPRILSTLKNLPADVISGHLEEKHIMVSLKMYQHRESDRHIMDPLKNVQYAISFNEDYEVTLPLIKVVLDVMETHPDWRDVQICGLSIMYHVFRRVRKELTYTMRRRILRAVLKGHKLHLIPRMNRKIPTLLLLFKFTDLEVYFSDVVFSCIECMLSGYLNNFAVVTTLCFLRKLIDKSNKEQKSEIIKAEAVETLCSVLERNETVDDVDQYDTNVIENVWNSIFSITDSCPEASRIFVQKDGLIHIETALRSIKDTEIMDTLLGIVANIAEVEDCHKDLLIPEIKSTMVKIVSDCIKLPGDVGDSTVHAGNRHNIKKYSEETQNAVCCALVHILSANPQLLHDHPTISADIALMVLKWNFKKKREICYKDLLPLAKLLKSGCNVAVYYALWEVTSMVYTNAKTYVPMLKRDGLLEIIKTELDAPPSSRTECMIQEIVNLVNNFEEYSKLSKNNPSKPKTKNENQDEDDSEDSEDFNDEDDDDDDDDDDEDFIDDNSEDEEDDDGDESEIDDEFADPMVFELANAVVDSDELSDEGDVNYIVLQGDPQN